MSQYAIDESLQELVCFWPTPDGSLASRICSVRTEGGDAETPLRLAKSLTALTQALWRCYTHPASAATSLEVNTEGWRRQKTREGFDKVVDHIENPNLPFPDGNLIQSYDPVEESAHRVGRQLHAIGDSSVLSAVVADVEKELVAVKSAELGDFSGRAAQAVLLTREDVSPVQLVAALEALTQDPFGPPSIFTSLDPTTACAAAAEFLRAASIVAATAADLEPTQAVLEADNIEALPHQTPTSILELMIHQKMSPAAAVVRLVGEAMSLADGKITDTIAALAAIEDSAELSDLIRASDPTSTHEPEIRLTTIDLRRPAPDMLEDLIHGIHGCWLLWQEYNYPDDEDDSELLEEEDSDATAHLRSVFRDAVRSEIANLEP